MADDRYSLPGSPLGAHDGPVFDHPWQAQAFALVVNLHQAGLFEWKDWAERFTAEIAAFYAAWRGAVSSALRALMDEGELAAGDPDTLATALVGLGEGLAVQGLFDAHKMPPARLKAILGAGVDCMLSCGDAR